MHTKHRLMNTIDPTLLDRVNTWLSPTFDTNTQEQIKHMISNDPEALDDAFYKNLAFGTVLCVSFLP